MASRVDKNEVVLKGKVLQAKAWDPKGREFTSGSVTLRVGDQDVPISVRLSVTQKFDERKPFEKIFSQGAQVLVTKGFFGSYEKTDKATGKKTEVFQVESPLGGCLNVEGEEGLSQAVVTGTVAAARGDRGVVEANYWSKSLKGPGTMKIRKVRVQIPGDAGALQGKHVTLLGEISKSDGGPFLRAKTVLVTV